MRRSSRRGDIRALLRAKNPRQEVSALTELEAYYAIKEIGLYDAGALLKYFSQTQTRAALDLDVWRGGQLQASDLLTWLTSYQEADVESLFLASEALDIETLALFFSRRLLVALNVKEDEEHDVVTPDWVANPPLGVELVTTPDQRFIIAARLRDVDEEGEEIEEEERKAIVALVGTLYKSEDPDHIAHALRLAYDELATTLEEDAYRFRNARLEDLGFPSPERAIEVYGPLAVDAPDTLRPEESGYAEFHLPVPYIEPLGEGFFTEVMRTLPDASTVARVEEELIPLANAMLVADRVSPADTEAIKDALLRLRSYLELSLAHGSDGSLEEAGRKLSEVHLRDLFRRGYTLTLKLKTRAQKLAASGVFQMPGGTSFSYLSKHDEAFLAALLLPRPRFLAAFRKLTPATVFARLSWAPFASEAIYFPTLSALEVAEHVLVDLEDLASCAESLGFAERLSKVVDVALPPPAERHFDDLVRTLVANAALGHGLSAAPLAADALAALKSQATGGTLISGDEVKQLLQYPSVRARADSLGKLLEESAEIEPRFFEGVFRTL